MTIESNRWRVRRRFAIVAFVELVTAPFWAGYAITHWGTTEGIVDALILAMVGIVGAYIGGVVVDDNWKK